MSLSAGARLGPFEILSTLGAGGMGEVYRATDTTLGRQVAIKVLPEAFAQDAERLARFEREAKTLATLNHPNIAQIYGLERSNGLQALVMELVEGEDLSQRIARGPIPLDEALAIARQMAEALEAAHERGIIHRDLKPANIKVRPDGTAKVLDFGLAKLIETGSGIRDSGSGTTGSMSPTITSPALAGTMAGTLLGTAAYMSPEQAKGREADKRSDIWAFGCVLYEMLTGQRAFDGDDMTEVLGAVVRLEPNWDAISAEVPPSVRTLLQTSLVKDRRRRVGDISTALFVLDRGASLTAATRPENPASISQETADAQTAAAVAAVRTALARSTVHRVAIAGTAAALVTGAVASTAVWLATRPAPPRVERFTIVGSGATGLSLSFPDRPLTITPDGTHIVYAAEGGRQLLVRALDQLEETTIATGAIRNPFVAPDGQWIGFVDDLTLLKKVAITGGPAVAIAQMDGGARGATWAPNDAIIFGTTNTGTGLQRVSAGGGDVTVLTRPDRSRGEADHLWPEMLPGGRAVLFTIAAATGGLDAAQVAVLDLATGAQKTLLRGGSHGQYVPTGHLVYAAAGTLRAVAFDLGRLEMRGTPVPVLPRLVTTAPGAGLFALAADGTLVYGDAGGAGPSQTLTLVWVDRQGREQPLGAPARVWDDISISPDGRQIVAQMNEEGQGAGVWMYDIQRGTLARRVFEDAVTMPSWTADGARIVFAAGGPGATGVPGGQRGLFWIPADGSGPIERLTTTDIPAGASSASPDGRVLAFESRSGANADIWIMPLPGERKAKPLFETPFAESTPRFSPDGRWLAYTSNESGRSEVYVQPFPGPGGKWLISTGGGFEPIWSRNGRELFYRSGDKMMAVDIQTAPALKATTPRMLFERPGYATGSRQYDIAPDGQRFLMLKQPGEAATPPQIVVVKNWFEDLKRLVPGSE